MAFKKRATGDTCKCGHQRSAHLVVGGDGACEQCERSHLLTGQSMCPGFELHYRWGQLEPLSK